jgi:hypothetical protein
MRTIILFLSLALSSTAFSAVLTCEAKDLKVTLNYSSATEIKASLRGETAFADGIISRDEVDLIVRFPIQGELTIYARIGQLDAGNYLYYQGKRNQVVCR